MPRKVLDKAFKLSAIKLIIEKEHPVKSGSSTLGLHPNSLYQCVQEYEKMDKVRSQDMGAHFVVYLKPNKK